MVEAAGVVGQAALQSSVKQLARVGTVCSAIHLQASPAVSARCELIFAYAPATRLMQEFHSNMQPRLGIQRHLLASKPQLLCSLSQHLLDVCKSVAAASHIPARIAQQAVTLAASWLSIYLMLCTSRFV